MLRARPARTTVFTADQPRLRSGDAIAGGPAAITDDTGLTAGTETTASTGEPRSVIAATDSSDVTIGEEAFASRVGFEFITKVESQLDRLPVQANRRLSLALC